MNVLPTIASQPVTLVNAEEVVQVEHVYKEYRQYSRQMSLRHETDQALKRMFSRYSKKTAAQQPFYALRDVTFSVHKGEAVGIVGHNGAGKTTLLRLLSHITTPSSGTIRVNGRFATLIGLSAGFNMDMPGRQNIYLNAAFFGWRPQDVREIEQEIIDFADIGDFIDAPVKVYSSGMIARLGFSIAIHILPDIIFLDEVLSVGDAKFAAKCEQRIRNLRDEHRTIVMVSHSEKSVQEMCTRAILLSHGELIMDDVPETVLRKYALRSGM